MPDLTIERLQMFLLVVMPGIIAIKVYDLFYPPEKRDLASSLLEAVAYGMLNLAIWVWPLLHINQKGYAQEHPIWYATLSSGFLVVSPAMLALVTVYIRNMKLVGRYLGYPVKSAWDAFFRRGRECWVLIHLKDKRMVGGYFGPHSYATTFPSPPELYLEEVYRVDEAGKFVEMVPGTEGMVIRLADCERVEFLKVDRKV